MNMNKLNKMNKELDKINKELDKDLIRKLTTN